MDDEEIIEYCKKLIEEKRLKGRGELSRIDSGLYSALSRRKLLDDIGLGSAHENRKEERDWVSMDDEDIVAYGKRTIEEREIRERKHLRKADRGLYKALRKRKLLDRLFPETGRRPRGFFTKMTDTELIEYACRIVEGGKMKTKEDLRKADAGLTSALYGRGLIDRVFAPIESEQRKEAVQQVVDAMKEFGE